MNQTIEDAFAIIKQIYGSAAIERVERMLLPGVQQQRHPLQRGAKWIMPGLPSKPWLDPYDFPQLQSVVRGLDAHHADIKKEIHRVMEQSSSSLAPYAHHRMQRDDWQALYLFRDGRAVVESRELVPASFAVMEDVVGDWLCPLLEMHFSILQPGAVIPPHCDLWNFTINLHLAVDIPGGCGIRVADVEREWEEGKCLLFDYSYLHSAWNRSNRPRVCLLMDLWNPHVTLPEREALLVLIREIRRLVG